MNNVAMMVLGVMIYMAMEATVAVYLVRKYRGRFGRLQNEIRALCGIGEVQVDMQTIRNGQLQMFAQLDDMQKTLKRIRREQRGTKVKKPVRPEWVAGLLAIPNVEELLKNGQQLSAIKVIREAKGLRLLEAKNQMEQARDQLRREGFPCKVFG